MNGFPIPFHKTTINLCWFGFSKSIDQNKFYLQQFPFICCTGHGVLCTSCIYTVLTMCFDYFVKIFSETTADFDINGIFSRYYRRGNIDRPFKRLF